MTILYQFECTKNCADPIVGYDGELKFLPTNWDNEIVLTASAKFAEVKEVIENGFICPECGARGNILNIILYDGDSDGFIDMLNIE